MPNKENENLKGEDDSPSAAPGSVQNGVATRNVNCIGCGQEFEDLHLVDYEEPDPMPVCDKCIETMEP